MDNNKLEKQAIGIVAQLFDLAEVPVEKRQQINDKAYDYMFEQLRLHSVVGRSEQLLCCCDNPNGFKEMEEGKETCSQCGKPY